MQTMHIDVDGCRLSFSVAGPEHAPAVLLLNALGTTTGLWDAQLVPFSPAMQRWFTERFRRAEPATVDRFRSMISCCPVAGYKGCCAALRDADLRDDLRRITAPSLVVAGTLDPATPPSLGDALREGIPGARGATLDAAHLANVEQAEAFTTAVIHFLNGRAPDEPGS